MKPISYFRNLIVTAVAPIFTVSSASGGDGTWTLNNNGNWSDTANWSGGTVADGTDANAYLSNVINANRVITLDTVRTIGNIYAQDTSNDFTISGTNALTLDVSSGQSILSVVNGRTLNIGTALTVNDGIDKQGAGAVSITGAVTLGGAQTWTNNSTGALSKTNASLLDNNGHQLTFDGTGGFNLGTINNATAVLTGSGALVKNGSGRLNIGGVNSGFTGTVAINGGVLQMTNNAGGLGAGNVALNGGVLSFYWGTTYTRTLGTGDNQVQLLGGESGFAGAGTSGPTINLGATVVWGGLGEGTATGYFNPGKFVLGDEGTTNAASTTFASGIDLNGGTRTIKVPAGLSSGLNRPTISGAISNSTGTGNLNFEVDGFLTLSNNSSSWNGSTAVSGTGIVNFGGINENNIGDGSSRSISVAAGSAVRFNALSNAILNRLVETTDEFGVMTGGGANDLDFSGSTGANLSNAFLGNFATNGAKAEVSGTITPGSNGYLLGAKGSSGLLGIRSVLSGENDLTVGGTGATGIRVNIVGTNTHSGETVINSGSKLTLGNNLALQNSALNVGAAGGSFALAAGTNAGRITGETAASSPTLGGLIGSRNLFSAFTNAGGNNETNLANTAVTGFTLNPGAGTNHVYSGSIGGFGAGAAGGIGGSSTLAITGSGTQELTGVHTYTGATSINGGTLLISGSGSINSSSAVTVDGGTLRYNSSVALTSALTFTSGTISGTNLTGASFDNQVISTGKTISPGNSPGTMSVGSQEWAGGGSYLWEINNVTGTAGTDPGWDLLSGTGNLTISATDLNPFNILLTSLDLFNDAGDAANFSDAGNYSWMIADFNGEITTFTADAFALNTSGFTNDFTGTFDIVRGDASGIGGDNSQIWVTYTAIPEPHTAFLSVLGVLLLLRRKRS